MAGSIKAVDLQQDVTSLDAGVSGAGALGHASDGGMATLVIAELHAQADDGRTFGAGAIAQARQRARNGRALLRMRDMGGIIVVDFIDLHSAQNRKTLYEKLKEEMKRDRAKHTILPPSKFGLIQITRQRVRPETNITTVEKCPACNGTGEIKASILLVDEIENNMRYFVQEQNEKELFLSVHPYLEAYLNKGLLLNSRVHKWRKKFKVKLKVSASSSYHIMEYHFFNKLEEEIKI